MLATRRNNVTVTGPAGRRPMVFVHGLGCDQGTWRYVAPAFEPNHRIVLFDHVGAGASDRSYFDPAKYQTLHGYADDLLDICRELELEDIVLVGHSAGAMIGLLAAAQAPERFGALVVLGPSPRYVDDAEYVGGFSAGQIDTLLDGMARDYQAWCAEFPRTFMGNPDRPELGDELSASFVRGDPALVHHLAETIFRSDHRRDLASVTTPVLVIQASEEPIAPQEVGRYVHAQLPDSELILLQAAGHFPHMSAPAEIVTAIYAFLERQATPSVSRRGGWIARDPELEDLYEHAPFGYVSTGLDWHVERINQTLLDLVGRSRDEVLGSDLKDLFTPAGQLFHTTHAAPQLELHGVLGEVSIELQRADGSSMPALISSLIRTDHRGRRTIRSSMLDATQRQGYERKLLVSRRRSERRLRLMQQVVADLAAATSVAEVARVLADAAADAFGVTAARLWLLDPDARHLVELAPLGQTARQRPVGASTVETDALRSNEVLVDEARGVVAAAARQGARPVGTFALELDDAARFGSDERHLLRTLAQQAGQALDRALVDERRQRLLSMVSHELRTPLTPIVGFSELALERYADLSDETRAAFEVIKRNGEHLIAVVDDLKSLTRSRHGLLAPDPIHVELAPMVGRLLSDLSEHDVEVVIADAGTVAWVDVEHLTQVVTNLLSNARRYGEPPVVVRVASDGDVVSLVVEDAGEGVPPAFVDRLFDAFAQADEGDHRSSAGLGLGLAISRELVLANGGELAYEPVANGGARFVVSLPCQADRSATPITSEIPPGR